MDRSPGLVSMHDYKLLVVFSPCECMYVMAHIYNHLAPFYSSRIDFGVALFSSFLLSNQYSWTSSFRGVIRGFTLPHKPIDSIDWSAVNRGQEFDGPKSFNLPQIQGFFFLTIIVSQSLCQSISQVQISSVLIGLSGISFTTIDI